jgi:hypothetical protein
MAKIPDYDDLPKVEGMPAGCAWGVFDKDGKKDVYGTLNLLTPDVVKAAVAEVKDGVSISLNWPIGAQHTPGFGRKGLVHKVIDQFKSPFACHAYDEEIEFNTQCSSQWDSFVHFQHQGSAKGYNGVQTSAEELTQSFGNEDKDMKLPTLNHWHRRGGIVGRGVLIDYKTWADQKGIRYDPFSDHRIKISELEEVAKAEGVTFKQGDIIIVRSGFTEALGEMNAEQQSEALGTHLAVGVEGTEKSAKWFWNKHFAGAAGDMIAFETVPPLLPDGNYGQVKDLVLHQMFLSLFGLPIGELWDLKGLSEHCARTKRYSFLLTSVPLNVPGSVGSPSNALAIF